jgi:acetylglutamate kinase
MAAYAALGQVNAQITSALKDRGVAAVGLHAEPKLFACQKKQYQSSGDETVDLGWVGSVESVDTSCFGHSDASVFVISPIGWDGFQNRYNINADDAALALAIELEADSLVFASDVPGVLVPAGTTPAVVSWLDCASAWDLICTGQVTGGMIPKLVSSIDAIKSGVKKVSIISGKKKAALVDLLVGKACVGTTILLGLPGRSAVYGPTRSSVFDEPETLKQIA